MEEEVAAWSCRQTRHSSFALGAALAAVTTNVPRRSSARHSAMGVRLPAPGSRAAALIACRSAFSTLSALLPNPPGHVMHMQTFDPVGRREDTGERFFSSSAWDQTCRLAQTRVDFKCMRLSARSCMLVQLTVATHEV